MEKKHTILCVDDEELIVKGLRMSLELEGYRILTATSGEEALRILEKENVDLIISDQRMPRMEGSELLRIVRAKYPNVISIMLSGYSDFEALVDAVNEGEIFRFVGKPWDDREFKNIIHAALEQRRVINIVEKLMSQLSEIVDLAEHIDINKSLTQNCISIKLGKEGTVIPKDVILRFLNILFDSLGVEKSEKLKVVSGAVAQQEGIIIITIDIGQGVNLKIEVPHAKNTELT